MVNQANADQAGILQEVPGLESSPVAVKFLAELTDLDGFKVAEKSRYCQALMRARRGESVYLTPDEITCPASARALGFKPPPEKLISGEMPAAYGLFGSPEAASRTIGDMPVLEMGKYRAVALAALAVAPFEPDVVVVEAQAEQVMWLAAAISLRRRPTELSWAKRVASAANGAARAATCRASEAESRDPSDPCSRPGPPVWPVRYRTWR